MKSFRDGGGRLWTLAVNVASVRRVKGLVGVNLYALVEDGCKGLGALLGDPLALADVLYCLCKEQADAAGVSDEEFGQALYGDAIEAAADALVEELIDFFPDPARRENLRKVARAAKGLQERLLAREAARLAGLDLDALAGEVERRSRPPGSSRSSGTSPAPPA